jgi:dihydrofolate synthase/folylpolyglutamate synthase
MEAMSLLFPGRKLNIVVGVLADKDYISSIDIAKPYAKKFYAVSPPSYRALKSQQLANEIHHHSDAPVEAYESIPAALESALNESKKDDVICIFGSLYQVGEIRSYFGRKTF